MESGLDAAAASSVNEAQSRVAREQGIADRGNRTLERFVDGKAVQIDFSRRPVTSGHDIDTIDGGGRRWSLLPA